MSLAINEVVKQGSLFTPELSEVHEFDDVVTRRLLNVRGDIKESVITSASNLENAWSSWWKAFLIGKRIQYISGPPRKLKTLDLFASAGGLSLGVEQAAISLGYKNEIQGAVDLDSDALATYKRNFNPVNVIHKSVSSLIDFQTLNAENSVKLAYDPVPLDDLSDLRNQVDILVGGPPCQGHSSLNNHTRGRDFRNSLYLTMPAIGIALNAKAIIIENVPRVTLDHGKVVAKTTSMLRDYGYKVSSGVLSADDLGWPQTRSRHFLIASRIRQPLDIGFVASIFKQEPRDVLWAIGDLQSSFGDHKLLDTVPQLSPENFNRINWLFDNDAFELPNHERPDCHKNGHTYPSVYGRMYPDKPAPTLTSGYQSPGRGRFVHPTERRVLTSHEAARLQGFPDNFEFVAESKEPTRAMLQKWIGDAVPSILGYVAGITAIDSII